MSLLVFEWRLAFLYKFEMSACARAPSVVEACLPVLIRSGKFLSPEVLEVVCHVIRLITNTIRTLPISVSCRAAIFVLAWLLGEMPRFEFPRRGLILPLVPRHSSLHQVVVRYVKMVL
ncbi:hypothetical protein A2U01_0045355 [Trifolium medium]|uniref:Uncharacterized protein n=1 Tax=Trifolium medium TaxID=97028 RepID=A0A392QJY9_9FABA|nr:hypothetical protein [Trifolium medium]